MKHRSGTVALLAILALTIGGCTSSNGDDEAGEDAAASASASADGSDNADGTSEGDTGGGDGSGAGSAEGNTSTGIDPDAGTNNPTATVEWGKDSQTFLLVLCDAEGPSSLEASGDDLAAGSIMTLRATNGSGQVLIESDSTLDEEFYGEFTSFSYNGGKFEGSGTYEADDETGDFTLRGDCKDL